MSNSGEFPLVKAIVNDVKDEKLVGREGKTIYDDNVRVVMPFHSNLLEAVFAFPMFIYRRIRCLIDKTYKEKYNNKQVRIKARDSMLALGLHIDKCAKSFETAIEENLNGLSKILKHDNYHAGLSDFLNTKGFKALYSYSEGKHSGILKNKTDLEEFKNAIINENKEVIEKYKIKYVKQIIKTQIKKNAGSFLPNYSQSVAQMFAKIISGMVPTYFIANDFYNLKILNTNDKKKSQEEWNSKFTQESFKIGLDAYQGFILNTVFEKMTNASLSTAIVLNIVNNIAANVLSRKFTHRPVLPVSTNEAVRLKEENDRKINEQTALQKQTFAANKISFGANNKQILTGVSKYFADLDRKFIDACPNKWTKEKFKEAWEQVSVLNKDHADDMLEIAAHNMGINPDGEKLTIEHIMKAASDKDGNVIIGTNEFYRYSKALLNFFVIPFTMIKGITKFIINQGRRIFGYKPFPNGKKESDFLSAQFVKNVSKWAKKAHEQTKDIPDLKDRIDKAQILYGRNEAGFFGFKILSYSTDKLSTGMKLTGFTGIPFLAFDAYNATLGETKDKDASIHQMNQRTLQDTVRQGVSYWFVQGSNNLMKSILNANISGLMASYLPQAVIYETATRLMVGQPIMPTTYEKMVEVEKKRANNTNWFIKAITGKVKTAENTKQTKTTSYNLNTQLQPSGKYNASELFKKFNNN